MTTKDDRLPDWLKRLQENSWELELLISGGAIFSLFQLADFFINWVQIIRMNNHLPGMAIILMIGMVGIKMLNLGFILHLILRAYWIALICINYVYPNGINPSRLKLRKPFKIREVKEGNLKSQIIRVDNFCGTVLYLTITSVIVIFGIILTFGCLIPIVLKLDSSGSLTNAFMLLLTIYIVDLITFGLFRRIPILSYLIFPVFKVLDVFTLRFIYGKSLNLFMSNVPKLKAFIAGIFFIFSSVIFAYLSLYKVMHWPNAFDNRAYRWQMTDKESLYDLEYMENWNADNTYRIMGGISPKVVEGNYLEIYFRYTKSYDEVINAIDSTEAERNLAELIEVQIDQKVMNDVDWMHSFNQYIGFGIGSMIPLDSFGNGKHIITFRVKDKYLETFVDQVNRPPVLSIPFWIDRRYNIKAIKAVQMSSDSLLTDQKD